MGDSVGTPDFQRTSQQARSLWESMSGAFAALQAAHARYAAALGIAADTEHLNPDGFVALRQRGRDYATAVMQYSKAVMAWLTFADTSSEEANRFIAGLVTSDSSAAAPAVRPGDNPNSWHSVVDHLRVDIELNGDLLLAVITGTMSFQAASGVLRLVVDRAVENKTDRVLVYSLGVHGELPISDKYRFFAELAAYVLQEKPDLKLALVAALALDGFGVPVAQNRGARIQVFSSREGAIQWLDAVR